MTQSKHRRTPIHADTYRNRLTNRILVHKLHSHDPIHINRYRFGRCFSRAGICLKYSGCGTTKHPLDQLEEDGLSQNTIVFYYSDHGGSMPRGKSYIYDSGTHVPLIIRVPKKWQSIKLAWMVTTWK